MGFVVGTGDRGTGDREFLVRAAEDEALIDIRGYSGGSVSPGHGPAPTPLPRGHTVVHSLRLQRRELAELLCGLRPLIRFGDRAEGCGHPVLWGHH